MSDSFDSGVKSELPRNSKGAVVTGEKSAGLAVVLGFLITGAGLMYAGRVGLGFVFLICAVLFCWTFIVPIVLWIVGMVKAYNICKENNLLWAEYLNNR